MLHLFIFVVLAWIVVNTVRRILADRRTARDMAKRFVPRSPELASQIAALGVARQAEARRWEQERHEIRDRMEAYATIAERKRIERLRKQYHWSYLK